MTDIKTLVYADRTSGQWIAEAEYQPTGCCWTTYCHSWPEAMQAAYAMQQLLARLLTDQVYAERLVRRFGPLALPTTLTPDPHTMEATA